VWKHVSVLRSTSCTAVDAFIIPVSILNRLHLQLQLPQSYTQHVSVTCSLTFVFHYHKQCLPCPHSGMLWPASPPFPQYKYSHLFSAISGSGFISLQDPFPLCSLCFSWEINYQHPSLGFSFKNGPKNLGPFSQFGTSSASRFH
jgi:hypothetical protein